MMGGFTEDSILSASLLCWPEVSVLFVMRDMKFYVTPCAVPFLSPLFGLGLKYEILGVLYLQVRSVIDIPLRYSEMNRENLPKFSKVALAPKICHIFLAFSYRTTSQHALHLNSLTNRCHHETSVRSFAPKRSGGFAPEQDSRQH